MVNYDAQTYLENLFKNRWTADSVIVGAVGEVPLRAPTQFENADFDDGDFEYIYRPIVEFGSNLNIGLGAYCQRQKGKLFVHLFHKPGSGMALALKACDDIKVFFTNKTFMIYEFQEASVRKVPRSQDGWVQTIVTCPFHFDIRS